MPINLRPSAREATLPSSTPPCAVTRGGVGAGDGEEIGERWGSDGNGMNGALVVTEKGLNMGCDVRGGGAGVMGTDREVEGVGVRLSSGNEH